MGGDGFGGPGPVGFDFAEAMKGKGKGMMPGMSPPEMMQMPQGPQPPGYWQPWGVRFQPPPIILPNTTPATASEKQADGAEKPEKGKGKSKGKGKGGDEKGEKGEKGGKSKGKSAWSKGEAAAQSEEQASGRRGKGKSERSERTD